MPTATVNFFATVNGFGFIQPEGGVADVFVHISEVERSGMRCLQEGARPLRHKDGSEEGLAERYEPAGRLNRCLAARPPDSGEGRRGSRDRADQNGGAPRAAMPAYQRP
jgi:cold shock CspA family protein